MTDFDHNFALLRERYRGSLANKRIGLEAAWRAFRSSGGNAETLDALLLLVHRLAGSAPAYGYEALGELASEVNRLLAAGRSTDQAGTRRSASHELIDKLAPRVGLLLSALAESADSVAASSVQIDPGRASPLRVTLIEDDPEQALGIQAALESQGCEVAVALHSDSLWELITIWPCDVVLVDYWLDRETALDIVRLIRSEPSFSTMAVICLTVETNPDLLRNVLEGGCDAVLSKSETPQRFVEVLLDRVAVRRGR
jgi:CheY-like chemotaxis protein/HPt (histidine-containing phosphotransfer) domain-containing protein